jgi:hypothetical protein
MQRSRWRRSSRALVPAAVAALIGAFAPGALAGAASPAPVTGESPAAAQSVRTLVRRASLSSLSHGIAQLPRGTKGPEVAPADGEEGAGEAAAVANRSHSQRPDPRALAAAAAVGPLRIPVVQGSGVLDAGTRAKQSFEGLNLFQERYVAGNGNQFTFEPPDQGMCVGNGFVLESVNDALRVYDTAGHALTRPIDLNSFYGYPPIIDRTTGVFGPEPTDPSCLYDSINRRWIHIILTLDVRRRDGALTLNNHIDIAVSKTADPTRGWTFYSLNATDDGRDGTPSHTDCPCVGDYPHIGADHNGVYITTNEYPWSSDPGVFGNNFNGAQLYAFSRHALSSGADRVRFVQFENLALTGGAHPIAGFTVIPANSPDGVFAHRDGGSEYFLSTAAAAESGNTTGRANIIGLWTLSNTQSLNAGTVALHLRRTTVPSEVYAIPPASEQKLGNVPLRDCLIVTCLTDIGPSPSETEGPLDSSDTRIFNTWYDGTHIWGSLSTAVQVANNIHAGSAWFAVNPSGTMGKQGYVAVADNNVIYAGIATLASGKGAMGVTLVGHDWYPSAAYAFIDRNGPGVLHVAAKGAGPEDGFCEYTFFNCAGTPTPHNRPRWGDYPAAQASGNSIWIANEYIAHTCTFTQYKRDPFCGNTRGVLANWSTRVTQLTP